MNRVALLRRGVGLEGVTVGYNALGVLGHFLIHPQDLALDHSFERALLFRVKHCAVGHMRSLG